jgi:CubicO group peptidase (beta-lactamase class C family)
MLMTSTLTVIFAEDRNLQQEIESRPFLLDEQLETSLITSTGYFDDAALDSFIIATMDQYHIPGLSACIIQDGMVYWSGSYGYSDIERNITVTDSTIFRIASLSKTFTVTALMQLWEDNLFELDDDINNYLPPELQITNPSFPNDAITFRQLLTHTSSIDSDGKLISSLFSLGSDYKTPLDTFLINYFMPRGEYYSWNPYNNWAPGSQREYSNPAISLAGYLVEVIADTPFAEYCQNEIFNPLGMTNSSWFLSGLDTNEVAKPYVFSDGNYQSYPLYGFPIIPAGGLMSNIPDLSRYLNAYMLMGAIDGVRILDSTTIDLITTEQIPRIASGQGLIWWIYELFRPNVGMKTYCGHTGSLPGYHAGMDYQLDNGSQYGVIIITNGNSSQGRDIIWDNLYIYGLLGRLEVADEKSAMPAEFALHQNYPNPFNPSTTLSYGLPYGSGVSLIVYNLLGREVVRLVDGYREPGYHEVQWNGRNHDGIELPSGIYIARLMTPGYSKSIKMVLLK